MAHINTAVFLAAGLGSRLKGLSENKPKGFLEIGGISLIERSVQNLVASGITKFIFGTGFLSEDYDEFASKYNAVCIKNDLFAETGSMYTLYNLRKVIHEDFLLLEADLLYHPEGLRLLLDDPHPDAILASGRTFSNDEVFIETDAGSYLVNLSKSPAALSSVDAELVGISKVSLPTYKMMCSLSENIFPEKPRLDYEHAFVEVAKHTKLFVRKEEEYIWCEIDDESHFQRAVTRIYPQLKNFSK